jgi:pimeloyl-ACP methyl ester carboxylesterase
MPANPVIVVPGITAAYLDDHYPLPPETVWSVLSKQYERAALHPDNIRYEAAEPALVRGGQLFEVCYRELVEELRYNLREQEDEHVPVFPFSYDWRQPLETAAAQLSQFVDEVIARTALIREYDKAGYAKNPKVNLVGHSMGGLVILTHLQNAGKKAKVGKVATLATPFRGSFESVIKITTGTANLGTTVPSSREREAARLTPSLYYLFPDLPEAIETDPPIPKDLFDPAAWQTSVVDTIEEYIRLHGLDRTNRRAQARNLFAKLLGDAKSARQKLTSFKLEDAGLGQDDWLCVVGVDSETRVRLKIVRSGRSPEFDFDSSDRQNRWDEQDPALKVQTGDGTVPYPAALPHFLPPEKLVCVRPKDYGYWELQDAATTKVAGFHGILPNMDMLHRLIVRFFKELEDSRGNTWGMPPVGVTAWNPPLKGGLRPKGS